MAVACYEGNSLPRRAPGCVCFITAGEIPASPRYRYLRYREDTGPVGFDPLSVFPCDFRSPVSHPTCDVPFPPRRPGEYWEGVFRPASCTRGSGDPSQFRISREWVGDWGGPETVWALLCVTVLSKGVPHGQTESLRVIKKWVGQFCVLSRNGWGKEEKRR